MHKIADLVTAATAVLDGYQGFDDGPVSVAGIFGHALPSNVEMATAGGAAATLTSSDNPLVQVAANITAMEAVQSMDAQRDGLTVRMLVALTDTRIYVLDWQTPTGPTRVLKIVDRATADVKVKRMGLSRRVDIVDGRTGESLPLSGTTAVFSPEAAGDKAVLHALDAG